MPFSCAASNASAICRAILTACSTAVGSGVDPLGQGLTLGQLHDQELAAVDVLEAVDRCDPGVLECGQHPCLALEAGQPLGVGGEPGGQHLDGHLAAELRVLGPPHLTHAALAELVQDLVVRNRLADHVLAFPGGTGTLSTHPFGLMFWLTLKRLFGSYFALTSASRS